jgi:hypothetical protein
MKYLYITLAFIFSIAGATAQTEYRFDPNVLISDSATSFFCFPECTKDTATIRKTWQNLYDAKKTDLKLKKTLEVIFVDKKFNERIKNVNPGAIVSAKLVVNSLGLVTTAIVEGGTVEDRIFFLKEVGLAYQYNPLDNPREFRVKEMRNVIRQRYMKDEQGVLIIEKFWDDVVEEKY